MKGCIETLLAGLLLIAACEPEQAAITHRSNVQKPLIGREDSRPSQRPLTLWPPRWPQRGLRAG